MLAKAYRMKNAALVLGMFVLCSIAMTVVLAGTGGDGELADTGNIEASANEAAFPDPPACVSPEPVEGSTVEGPVMAPMAEPPAAPPHETVVIGSQSSAEGDPAPGMPASLFCIMKGDTTMLWVQGNPRVATWTGSRGIPGWRRGRGRKHGA